MNEARELLNRAGLGDIRDPDRIPKNDEETNGDGMWSCLLEWDREGMSILFSTFGVVYYVGEHACSWHQFVETYRVANGQLILEHEQNRLSEIQGLIDNGTILDWDFSSHPGKTLIWRDILGGDLIYTAKDGWYYGYKTANKQISNKEAVSILTKLKEIEEVLK